MLHLDTSHKMVSYHLPHGGLLRVNENPGTGVPLEKLAYNVMGILQSQKV